MSTVTPHWKHRRLAPRVIRILERRATESPAIASFTPTTVPKAKAYIATYDKCVKCEATFKKWTIEGRTAVAGLLKQIQTWAPLLKRDVPGFDGSTYGDQPQVPDDVIEDGERMASVIDEFRDSGGNPLPYKQAALDALGPALQAVQRLRGVRSRRPGLGRELRLRVAKLDRALAQRRFCRRGASAVGARDWQREVVAAKRVSPAEFAGSVECHGHRANDQLGRLRTSSFRGREPTETNMKTTLGRSVGVMALGMMCGCGSSQSGQESDSGMPVGSGAAVVTSAEGSYWQLGAALEVTGGLVDITVDDRAEAQTWQGFGGAFTELGWHQLWTLGQAEREQAMGLLFGDDGARLAWGRIPIGGNDYVLGRYTLDDTGEDVIPDCHERNRPPADSSLASFSIERDLQGIVPFVKAAQAVRPGLRFWAIPWSPPVWLKTGYTKTDGDGRPVKRPSYFDGGAMKTDAVSLQTHAQYFVKFLQAYRQQGIDIELVAPQNEPAMQTTYPSCAWDKSLYTKFIGRVLGPALVDAGLPTRVMIGSLDDSRDNQYLEAVAADATALAYSAVAGVGYDMVAASKLNAINAVGLPVWVSEHKAGNYPWIASTYQPVAPNDLAYGIETWGLIRDAITKARVSAYNAWHMVLDKVGKGVDKSRDWAQNTLLVADEGQLTATPAYYVFRHFSRYVEPGAKVIATTGADAVAFKNPDGGLVTVVYNAGAAKTMTVAVGGTKQRFSMAGRSFATLVKSP